MESHVIKQTFRLGNSAGVILPIEWKGKKVEVKLIEKSISREVLEILDEEKLLTNTMGIFLSGSYARGEENSTSDIDILVITDSIDKQIKRGKYEILLVSKNKLDVSISNNLYFISLIREAKVILNAYLLNFYKKNSKGFSIKKSLDDIKSALKINEKAISIDDKLGDKGSDEVIYSIILRLREIYLIECLKKDKVYSNKDFLGVISKVSIEEAYNSYIRVKNDLKSKKVLSVEETRNLIGEIKRRLKNL